MHVNESLTIPTTFDSATNWSQSVKVIGVIPDESDCGCCWAFGNAEAQSDGSAQPHGLVQASVTNSDDASKANCTGSTLVTLE